MIRVAAVDPSVSATGLSLFEDGELQWAMFIGLPAKLASARMMAMEVRRQLLGFGKHHGFLGHIDVLVVEKPQVYAREAAPSRSVIQLALAAGAVIGVLVDVVAEVAMYEASLWKKQLSKEMLAERVMPRLTPLEISRLELPAPGLAHNVIESAGLGLYHLKRWTP